MPAWPTPTGLNLLFHTEAALTALTFAALTNCGKVSRGAVRIQLGHRHDLPLRFACSCFSICGWLAFLLLMVR